MSGRKWERRRASSLYTVTTSWSITREGESLGYRYQGWHQWTGDTRTLWDRRKRSLSPRLIARQGQVRRISGMKPLIRKGKKL